MPKVEILECDREVCQQRGAYFELDNGVRRAKVILCPEHAAPVNELIELGEPVVKRGRRPRHDDQPLADSSSTEEPGRPRLVQS